IGQVMPQLLEAFRTGGGVDWSSFGPDAIEAQGDFNRPWLRSQLATEYLPAIPAVNERLLADPPAQVLDMACGVGWAGISIAQGYSKVRVTGVDIDDSSIVLANQNALASGVAARVTFMRQDGSTPLGGPYDLALIVEALHDVSNPVGLLA